VKAFACFGALVEGIGIGIGGIGVYGFSLLTPEQEGDEEIDG
jgi:hypothetical protein